MKRLSIVSGMMLLVGVLPAAEHDMAHELDEVARAATVMVDGDACERIVTPRALDYMFKKDPRDQWVDGDNYEVNDQAFHHREEDSDPSLASCAISV